MVLHPACGADVVNWSGMFGPVGAEFGVDVAEGNVAYGLFPA